MKACLAYLVALTVWASPALAEPEEVIIEVIEKEVIPRIPGGLDAIRALEGLGSLLPDRSFTKEELTQMAIDRKLEFVGRPRRKLAVYSADGMDWNNSCGPSWVKSGGVLVLGPSGGCDGGVSIPAHNGELHVSIEFRMVAGCGSVGIDVFGKGLVGQSRHHCSPDWTTTTATAQVSGITKPLKAVVRVEKDGIAEVRRILVVYITDL